jgi:hypothetical protein
MRLFNAPPPTDGIHTFDHPYCEDLNCPTCRTNTDYHFTVTGAPLQSDVVEVLAAECNSLRGLAWNLQVKRGSPS